MREQRQCSVGCVAADHRTSYDAHGRIVESRERNFAFQKITTILYNAQGDKAEERRAITNNCAFPESSSAGVPNENSKFQYSYQYDSYGNWVEQTINHSSRPDEPLSVHRRQLTYY
jgi:hypothetical protein